MRALLPILVVSSLAWTGCDDELPAAPPDTQGPNYAEIFGTDRDDGPEIAEAPDVSAPVDVPSDDQCTPRWSFVRTEGGVAGHVAVDPSGATTLVAGSSVRRVKLNGQEDTTCTPYHATGEQLGSPALSTAGLVFLGSSTGRLHALTTKCKAKWPPLTLSAVDPVREAPALAPPVRGNETVLYVLDTRPALHRVTDLGNQPTHDWPHYVDDDALEGAAPIYSGGDNPFVVFPSRRMVTAVGPNGARRWQLDIFRGEGDEREVTSALAMTADRRVLFAAGRRFGDTFRELALYRLVPDTASTEAVVDAGYPIDIGIVQDTVTGIVLGPNGGIVLATLGHGIVKLDPDGKELWRFVGDEESLRVRGVPALGNDGSAYFMAEPHLFVAVDTDGHRIFRFTDPTQGELRTTSPAIHSDGTVLVHFGVNLLAYRCTASDLANSSWPRYQRNNRSTGNLQANN